MHDEMQVEVLDDHEHQHSILEHYEIIYDEFLDDLELLEMVADLQEPLEYP